MLKYVLNAMAGLAALLAIAGTSLPAHAFGPIETPTVDGPGL